MVHLNRRDFGLTLAGTFISLASVSKIAFAATDEVTIGIQGSSLIKLDPATGDVVRGELSVIRSVYSALTQVAADGSIQPDAAKSWEQVEDKAWEFELRDDLQFSNGVKLTAEHFVFSLERLLDPANSFPETSTRFLKEVTAEALGDYKVRIVTPNPFDELPERIISVFIMEPGWTAENNPTIACMGSGPYKMESFQRDQAVTLVANENWPGEAPAIKKFIFRSFANDATKKAALQAGEILASFPVGPSDIDELTAAGLVVDGLGSNRSHYLKINYLLEPLSDVRVRRALNMAINRQQITETIYHGSVEPIAAQALTPAYADYQTDFEPFPYDPEQAKALLAEAGYENGFDVVLSVPTGLYTGADDASQIIASQLGEIGVRVSLESLPLATWMDKLGSDNAPGLAYYGSKSNSNIGIEVLVNQTRRHFATHGTDEQLADYEAAINIAETGSSREERKAAIRRASEIARDEALGVWLWPQVGWYAHDAKLVWPSRADDIVAPYDGSFAAS